MRNKKNTVKMKNKKILSFGQLNENEDILSDKEEMASKLGIRNFKIEGVEIISRKPEYRIYGRINGELCFFDIDGDISEITII